MKELIEIQSKLKAPKGQYNSFGKYNYRSLEDITEVVKPLLKEQGCQLVISDELQLIGERYYIKATAVLTNAKGEIATGIGWAREDLTKKGMDSSQITGAASSYARKYALNGLFCIDDTQGADTDAYKNMQEHAAKSDDKRTELKNKVVEIGKQKGYSPQEIAQRFSIDSNSDIGRLQQVLDELEALPERQAS